MKRPHGQSGQAAVEMVFIIPLLLGLAVGVGSVIYICTQGVKVQQAANLAARIQGQERVSGGVSLSMIQQDNGVDSTRGDVDPTKDSIPLDAARAAALQASQRPLALATSVYGKLQRAVRSFFGAGEQQDVFVPLPQYGSVGYSDQVKVVRLMVPPPILGIQLAPLLLSATAYGGEDTHMYGLVRWGSTANGAQSNSQKFWTDPANLQGTD
jgi:hypothetical protein